MARWHARRDLRSLVAGVVAAQRQAVEEACAGLRWCAAGVEVLDFDQALRRARELLGLRRSTAADAVWLEGAVRRAATGSAREASVPPAAAEPGSRTAPRRAGARGRSPAGAAGTAAKPAGAAAVIGPPRTRGREPAGRSPRAACAASDGIEPGDGVWEVDDARTPGGKRYDPKRRAGTFEVIERRED
jgi:hypothetical protein